MKTGIYPNLEVILMVELHFGITIRENCFLMTKTKRIITAFTCTNQQMEK